MRMMGRIVLVLVVLLGSRARADDTVSAPGSAMSAPPPAPLIVEPRRKGLILGGAITFGAAYLLGVPANRKWLFRRRRIDELEARQNVGACKMIDRVGDAAYGRLKGAVCKRPAERLQRIA